MNDNKQSRCFALTSNDLFDVRRIRATVFLSKSEAKLLYDFAAGTDSFPELNALCEKLEKMALDCLTAHNKM